VKTVPSRRKITLRGDNTARGASVRLRRSRCCHDPVGVFQVDASGQKSKTAIEERIRTSPRMHATRSSFGLSRCPAPGEPCLRPNASVQRAQRLARSNVICRSAPDWFFLALPALVQNKANFEIPRSPKHHYKRYGRLSSSTPRRNAAGILGHVGAAEDKQAHPVAQRQPGQDIRRPNSLALCNPRYPISHSSRPASHRTTFGPQA